MKSKLDLTKSAQKLKEFSPTEITRTTKPSKTEIDLSNLSAKERREDNKRDSERNKMLSRRHRNPKSVK